jgi:hypothetical protein
MKIGDLQVNSEGKGRKRKAIDVTTCDFVAGGDSMASGKKKLVVQVYGSSGGSAGSNDASRVSTARIMKFTVGISPKKRY